MRKLTTTISGAGKVAGRLAAIAVAGTLAVFGCTTNLNPGTGEPYSSEPGLGPSSPTSTPGTSYHGGNVPMTSAYTSSSATTLSGGNAPMVSAYLASDPAANRSAYRMRILGPSDPAPTGAVSVNTNSTGQLVNTAQAVNPQATVNATMSSAATPVVVDDALGIVAVPVATSASGTTAGTSAGTSARASGAVAAPAGTNGAVTIGATNAATVTPTPATLNSNATQGLAGSTAASTAVPSPVSRSPFVVSPTVSSAGVMSPTAATVSGTVTPARTTAATTSFSATPPSPTGGATMASVAVRGRATGTLRSGLPAGGMISSSAVSMPSGTMAAVTIPASSGTSRIRAVSPTLGMTGSLRSPATTSRIRAVSPTLGGNGTSRVRIVRSTTTGNFVVTNQQP